jgi:DNA-binding CsgD family transcriptional regulator
MFVPRPNSEIRKVVESVARAGKAGVTQPACARTEPHAGLRLVREIPWGSHLCVFYETKQDLLDTAVAYFEAGLQANEFALWAVSGPISERDATKALRAVVPDAASRLRSGQIQIVPGKEWYLNCGQFDRKRVIDGWREKLDRALANGYSGMRVSGDGSWIASKYWSEFCAYEEELDRSIAGQRMIILCTYSLRDSKAVDVLDVVRAHQCTVARRDGHWEFLETNQLKEAKQEIGRLNDALVILSSRFRGHESLTPRERLTLAHIVRGASSKEAARMLGLSPRTVEFHRANLMRKLGARNTADLVRKVFGSKATKP